MTATLKPKVLIEVNKLKFEYFSLLLKLFFSHFCIRQIFYAKVRKKQLHRSSFLMKLKKVNSFLLSIDIY